MMDINMDLLQWSINLLIKKDSATRANKFAGCGIKNENISNKELTEEMHKPIIRKFQKRKVHSPFIDNIQGADLADVQINKGFRIFLVLLKIIANMHGLHVFCFVVFFNYYYFFFFSY